MDLGSYISCSSPDGLKFKGRMKDLVETLKTMAVSERMRKANETRCRIILGDDVVVSYVSKN